MCVRKIQWLAIPQMFLEMTAPTNVTTTEDTLNCREMCVRKIQWLAIPQMFLEMTAPTNFTTTEDTLNSTDTNLQSVFCLFLCLFVFPYCVLPFPFGDNYNKHLFP